MAFDFALGLALAIGLFAYFILALARPDKFRGAP